MSFCFRICVTCIKCPIVDEHLVSLTHLASHNTGCPVNSLLKISAWEKLCCFFISAEIDKTILTN
jgi:hypothetical protein